VLRRDESKVSHRQPLQVAIGRWQVDLASYRVTRADGAAGPAGSGETFRLTPTEWGILRLGSCWPDDREERMVHRGAGRESFLQAVEGW
jgi:hypothetical protein